MRPLLQRLALVTTILLGAGPASSATILQLDVDPAQSFLTPAVGVAESVSGTITLRLGALPTLANTTFDLIGLALSTSGGGTVALDPAIPGPGLGMLTPGGAFLIPTLFVQLRQGLATLDLAIPDLVGSVRFGPGGGSLVQASTSFSLAVAGPSGDLTVTLVAVPEPSGWLLTVAGLALLARAGRGTARSGEISR